MKNSKMKKEKKIMAGTLSLLVLVLFIAPYQLTANICDDALEDCAIDVLIVSAVAFLAGLAGGPAGALASAGAVASGYSVFCLAGFAFCETYVVN